MPLRQDPMARLLGVTFAERTGAGIVTTAQVEPCHLNPYRIAHGGFAYTMGCVTAMGAARLCLGRNTEVAAVSSQYPAALELGAARCESTLISDDGANCTYEIQVTDPRGRLCFTQLVTLRPASLPEAPPPDRTRTIFPAGKDAPKDPRTGLRYPMLSPGAYCRVVGAYLTGLEGDVSIMGADILPETSDPYGAAHPGLLYSVCDTGVGAAAGLLDKIGVTVSSAMTYFRPAMDGPIRVEVSTLRMGRIVAYFDARVRDARDALCARGQFTLHPKGDITDLFTSEAYNGV